MADAPVKLLLVDDDEDDYIITRDLISRIRDRRYQLDWAERYEAGLRMIRGRQHDLCLLDYRLGERTGLELLRETQDLSGRLPVILLTGQGDHEVDLAAMEAGAADYLIKGQLSSDTLDRAIRYALQRKLSEDHLRRERDLINRIMQTSPVGIIMTDREGKITFANHRAEQVLGLAPEVIAHGNCNALDWRLTDLEGNRLPGDPMPLKRLLEFGKPVQDLRHAIEWRGGRRTLLSTNAAPVMDLDGKIDGMVVIVEEISERLGLEAQLRQSQKMESLGQLAAGVAHDINNVLTVIQGHAGLLLSGAAPGSDSEKSLKQISAASDRAARFVKQLLLFTRKQVVQLKMLDLNGVLRNLNNMLPRMLGEDIALETRYGLGLPQIEADTGMIEQIVMNLAVNARDAMPKGGKLSIATSVADIDASRARQYPDAREGSFICLTVTDTGCGMDWHVLQRIFEPFFSTKEPGKGTGLGLATVYGVARQHRGWIEVQSEVGIGTTFRVYLPPASGPRRPIIEGQDEPDSIQGGSETILVVEDETGLREVVRKVLAGYGYHVLSAASGNEAIRIWDEFEGKVDLLLTDMIMPGGMTGSEMAAILKQRKPSLKIIYSSGYSSELVGKDLSKSEIRFLAKPYLPIQLAKLVRSSLDALPRNATHPAAAK